MAPNLDPASGANRAVLQRLARGAGHILAERVSAGSWPTERRS